MNATSPHIIDITHVSKAFGEKKALDNINLFVRKGEFMTILGPSGCGKTTLLRLLAGFETASEGEITLNGKDITDLPPHRRPVNTVFQKYALFPHLNVFDNIAFGLKLKNTPKDTIVQKVKNALRMVNMSDYEYRDVNSLSGGQQQRIAIARAIVNEPELLLLDEPLAALDLKMRKDMQLELKQMHDRLGITFVYVTHDQEEAQLDKVQRDGGFWIYQSKNEGAVKTKVVRFSDRYFSKFQPSSGTGGENARRGDKKIVNILFAVGLVILVFSIINYVNLTVAQASSRAKEMATRRLVGAQRTGIMTRLIAESMLMSLLSFVVGVVLAVAALPYAAQLLNTTMEQSALFTTGNILMVIAFVVVVGVLSGIIPAVVISRAKPIDVVHGTFRMKMKMRFSKVFIVFQNIMTIMMIGCALTMVLQVRHLLNAPLGYNHEHVLSLPASDDSTQLANYTAELRKMTCVENVSLCMGHPLNGGNNNTVTYDDGKTLSFQIMYGDEHFMPLLGLHLLRDNHVDDEEGVFVNRQTLRELGLPLDAKYIMIRDERVLVRGVLADFHIRGIMDEQHPVLIYIQKNIKWPWAILVKVNGDETEAYNKINELYKVTFKHDVSDFTNYPYLDQAIRYMYSQAIRMSTIVTLFAAIAIIISLLGLVAMSTYFIQQRRKEIAIRKVFGSTSRQIHIRLLRTFMLYVVVAFVPAVLLIHYFMTDWLSTYSYRIDLAWWIYLVAGLFCLVVSLVAVMAQSYKAANENPAGNVKAE